MIQYNEYYPFGHQWSTSWTRENSSNRFLYNAANELNSTTGSYETFFRGYDPVLGRFLQVDPLAHRYINLSPYQYSMNNPAMFNDPMGDKTSIIRRIYIHGHAWQYHGDPYGFENWMDSFGGGSIGGLGAPVSAPGSWKDFANRALNSSYGGFWV